MWISRRELARLMRESESHKRRADRLERELKDERTRHLSREDHLVNSLLRSNGQFPVKTETIPKEKVETPSLPKKPQLSALDESRLEFYKQCAVEQGFDKSDGEDRFWQEMSGSNNYIEKQTQ